ncbi:MAG: 4-hydroxy-3-methylbut-2-en-1-yl diphosphate synthase [Euryarchaeota archaeon]|nr:4-hydroxy-3-methylbut-2-en-1-yl diphosphate synthase [Euryarchaeota archaeon]
MELYCNTIEQTKRLKTREVMVGKVGVGGSNPIRVQSMTTTDTMDTRMTIDQSMRMVDAGCEIVRITAPSIKEAKNLETIKDGLMKNGYDVPLVADIHFTPNAAIMAASIVEKVRINPGNYADRKKFEIHEYSDASYLDELERIKEKFVPLIMKCKENGTAMRIGTNHGSLSDRILSRYGDTPLGMVESAMEFLRIAEGESYHDMILSMKASNTHVMVQAYRLLVKKMNEESMNYPLHLGVTEAGEAEDGRIKSAVGIGTLLEDGLGDTIRVSLTEEPEREIPVARMLVERYESIKDVKMKKRVTESLPYDPFFYVKRRSNQILNIGSEQVPRVIGDLSKVSAIKHEDLGQFGYLYSIGQDKWHISDLAVDFLYIGANSLDFEIPGTLGIIQDHSHQELKARHYSLFHSNEIDLIDDGGISFYVCDDFDGMFDKLRSLKNCVIIMDSYQGTGIHDQRGFMIELMNRSILNPVIIKRSYSDLSNEEFLMHAAVDVGGLQLDGMGDGVWLELNGNHSHINQTAFGILQASRTRISKTEYISCPSCGRTLFDLQETTAKIRKRTDHLKGIKIGIMGCIVNGPGEMADADYGYVGTGPGLISLYKGQEVVEKNIDASNAVDALIKLIASNGDWVEPNDD